MMFDSASDVMLLGEIPVELSGDSQDSIEEKSQEPQLTNAPGCDGPVAGLK
jgi:hypothetical protein